MKSSSRALLTLALLLALAIAGFVLLRQPLAPDTVQITDQLEAARAAGEAHDVNGMMKIISPDYHDAVASNPTQLRFFLSRFQNGDPVRVTQSIPVVTILGDTATSVSHVRVVEAVGGRTRYDRDITIQWKREDGTRLLVLPTKVWHAVSADYGAGIFGD